MNILIIEDEAPAARRLKKMILEIDPEVNVMAMYDSIETSVKWFNANEQPDLIFMDIELADGQSFEIFNQVKITAPVIFTTAYDEYALQAFKVNSIDYLLKPIETNALLNAIQKFKTLRENYSKTPEYDFKHLLKTLSPAQNYKSRFLIKTGEKFVSIEKESIAYFLSEEKATFLITFDNKRFIMDQTLDELEKITDPILFFRLNRQIIANIKAIGSIHNYFNGKLKLTLKPELKEEVIVSREKAPAFKDWLDN